MDQRMNASARAKVPVEKKIGQALPAPWEPRVTALPSPLNPTGAPSIEKTNIIVPSARVTDAACESHFSV